jgi:predicted phosphate transport protein (TIGR00153 family)
MNRLPDPGHGRSKDCDHRRWSCFSIAYYCLSASWGADAPLLAGENIVTGFEKSDLFRAPKALFFQEHSMRLSSLMPREERFFDMFDEAAGIVTRAAVKFLAMVKEFDRLHERSLEMHQEERAGDEVVGRIIQSLDRSFITPFDREDIHALATSLDDVLDNMEETAHRFAVFRIERPTEQSVAMAQIIRDCCSHLEEAIRSCRAMKNAEQIQTHLREIGRLENEADRIYRDTESALFANPPDLLVLIKQRELYGWLEETVDACKDVAHVISEIVIKGS